MTTHHSFTTYLPLSEEEIQIEVSFDFYPACKGARDRYGLQLEPDDDPDIDVLDVVDFTTGESLLPLQSTTYFAIENLCWEQMEKKYDDNHSND